MLVASICASLGWMSISIKKVSLIEYFFILVLIEPS